MCITLMNKKCFLTHHTAPKSSAAVMLPFLLSLQPQTALHQQASLSLHMHHPSLVKLHHHCWLLACHLVIELAGPCLLPQRDQANISVASSTLLDSSGSPPLFHPLLLLMRQYTSSGLKSGLHASAEVTDSATHPVPTMTVMVMPGQLHDLGLLSDGP